MDPETATGIFGTVTAEAGILAGVLFLITLLSLWANYKQWDQRNKTDEKIHGILNTMDTTLALLLDRQAR